MPFNSEKVNVFTDGSKIEYSSGAAYKIKGHSLETGIFQLWWVHNSFFFKQMNTASITLLDHEIRDEVLTLIESRIGSLEAPIVKDRLLRLAWDTESWDY